MSAILFDKRHYCSRSSDETMSLEATGALLGFYTVVFLLAAAFIFRKQEAQA
jgi:hypothetical protein